MVIVLGNDCGFTSRQQWRVIAEALSGETGVFLLCAWLSVGPESIHAGRGRKTQMLLGLVYEEACCCSPSLYLILKNKQNIFLVAF